ncbi:MAG: DRTGG domain-containing protein [Acidaminococcaceae bacterium]
MNLSQVCSKLNAKILLGEEQMEREVISACGADLMSDVLTFTKRKTLLLTGLTNIQVVRTAELSDLCAIVFVRGKLPGKDIIEAAKANDIPLLITGYTLFEACGRLYEMGIKGCPNKVFEDE